MQDLYPEIFRLSVSLFPSEDDDVVTSPYNSLLSLSKLVDHADAVLPVQNHALHDIVAAVDRQMGRKSTRAAGEICDLLGKGMDLHKHSAVGLSILSSMNQQAAGTDDRNRKSQLVCREEAI